MTTPVRVNYLNNKELLIEIHRSKNSYCSYVDPIYNQYDANVGKMEEITPEFIEQIRAKRAAQMVQNHKLAQKAAGLKNHQIKTIEVDPASIPLEDLVFRVQTYEHIPENPEPPKKPKSEADYHVRLLFAPFKHYIIRDGELVEVGRSHWKDGLQNGYFCQNQGRITNRLALMFIKLCERYSQRSNWRGYTYVDEMRSQALLQLSAVGLQFNERRSDNPFAYYTVTVSNAFTRILNLEKRNQNIRDDILIMNGVSPSITRQIDNELEQRLAADIADGVEQVESTMVMKKPARGRTKSQN